MDTKVGGKKYEGQKRFSYKSKSYVVSYCEPPIKDIEEFSQEKFFSHFSLRNVVAIEKLRGKKFNIYFDGKNVEFRNYNGVLIPKGDDYLGFKHLFYKSYSQNYIKLIENLKRIPFNLHGEIIGCPADSDIKYFKNENKIDIYFYDIYLNENWMDWEDFSLLMKEYDLPIVSLFYNGEWKDETFYSDLMNDLDVEGIVIRPIYEEIVGRNRLITKFTKEKFKKKTGNELDEFGADIRIFLYKNLSSTKVLWEAELIRRKIDISDKNNFSTIMGITSKIATNSINSYLAKEFYKESDGSLTMSAITKAMKKELPAIIKHLLELKQ